VDRTVQEDECPAVRNENDKRSRPTNGKNVEDAIATKRKRFKAFTNSIRLSGEGSFSPDKNIVPSAAG
jgi:hypothetical protein